MEQLKERCNNFLQELPLPLSIFCEKIELSYGYYHKWMRGELEISKDAQKRIDKFLKKYRF